MKNTEIRVYGFIAVFRTSDVKQPFLRIMCAGLRAFTVDQYRTSVIFKHSKDCCLINLASGSNLIHVDLDDVRQSQLSHVQAKAVSSINHGICDMATPWDVNAENPVPSVLRFCYYQETLE